MKHRAGATGQRLSVRCSEFQKEGWGLASPSMTLKAVTPSRVESRSVTPSKVRAVVEAVGGLGISVLAHDSGKPGRRVEHAMTTQEAEIQCEIRAEPDGAQDGLRKEMAGVFTTGF